MPPELHEHQRGKYAAYDLQLWSSGFAVEARIHPRRRLVTEVPSRARMKVILVDDNRDAADTLAAVLDLWGYQTRICYSAVDALSSALSDSPDCIVSDIGMPVIDGFDLARRVRAEPSLAAVRLICVSGYSDPAMGRRAAEAGFDYRLTKPADPAKLREILIMIEQIKEIATKTQELTKQNIELVGETRDVLKEVKQDVKEVKAEVKEVREEVKALKKDVEELKKDGPDERAPGP